MDTSSTVLIIAGFLIVVLGIFAGSLLSSLRDEAEPEEEGTEQAPPGGKKGRYTPVMRLWREKGTNMLVVEIDGKAYIAPNALDPERLEKLETSARDLRAWLGTGLLFDPDQPARAPHMPPAASAPAQAAAPAPVPPPAAAAPFIPPPAAPARSAAPKVGEPAPVVANKSMVMQIEDILQDMIAGTPLARNGLHLHEDPIRGVVVQVGTEYYEGIGSVPDSQIREVLQSAVATWESTQ